MVKTSLVGVAVVLAAVSAAAAQDVNPALVTACVQGQQQAMTAVDAANRRIELARQTNQPAAMRVAMDDLQLVLSSVRAQLAPCATLQAAAAPAAQGMANMPDHNMANMPAAAPTATAGATAPAAAAPPADPHGGHVMPAAPQARPAGAPAAATPPAAEPAQNRANMPGHDMANMSAGTSASAPAVDLPTGPEKLACTTKVDPKTAPRAAYAGKTYYFCSVAERDRFVKDPAAYRPE